MPVVARENKRRPPSVVLDVEITSMPQCACAIEVYCNRFVSLCVCVCVCVCLSVPALTVLSVLSFNSAITVGHCSKYNKYIIEWLRTDDYLKDRNKFR